MPRRIRKLTKISINLPTSLVENVDYLADEMETDRTDIIKEILEAIMENEDLIDLVFGEALPDEDESDEADEEEDESEEGASEEAESEE
jgi:predicted DNA-binding protein